MYYRAIAEIVAPLKAIGEALIAMVPPDPEPEPKQDAKGKGGMSAEAKKLEDAFVKQLDREVGKLDAIATRAARSVDNLHRAAFAEQVRAAVSVKLPDRVGQKAIDAVVAGFARENVALIKTVPERYFTSIAELVSREGAAGLRAEKLKTLIAERYDVSLSNAKRIANDQVGKLYGQINRARQIAAGVTHFVWKTSGDSRVRDEHDDLNGERFAWDSPPAEGIPGEAINCRCGAEPSFDAEEIAAA